MRQASARLETWRFRLLGLALLGVLGAHAAAVGSGASEQAMGVIGLLFVGTMVAAIGRDAVSLTVALLLAAPVALELFGLGASWSVAAGSWSLAPLLVVSTIVVSQRVTRAERADGDVVTGTICAFVLATCTFASLYAGLDQWRPGAFAASEALEGITFGRFLYFSFVSITTLGYGDIIPVHPAARALVSLEAVLGVLYPAVVMARVVALWAEGGARPLAAPRPGDREGRYAFLTALLAATLMLLPWIEGTRFGGPAVGLLLAAQLLGALYACGGGRIATRLGLLLVLVALLGHAWPGPPDAAIRALGLAAATGFFVLTAGVLTLWLGSVRSVKSDVIFASISVYLLLGFALGQAFRLLELLRPASLTLPGPHPVPGSTFVYFGFMTLTTTGFGEIAPTTIPGENLAALGACVGVFYPAILVARLVSLYGREADS